jgi:hypothetical protein
VLGITRENVSANGVTDMAKVEELVWGSLESNTVRLFNRILSFLLCASLFLMVDGWGVVVAGAI